METIIGRSAGTNASQPEAYRAFKRRVKDLMTEAGLQTQNELAQKMEMTPSTLTRKLQSLAEKRKCSDDFVFRLKTVLGEHPCEKLLNQDDKGPLDNLLRRSATNINNFQINSQNSWYEALGDLGEGDSFFSLNSEIPREIIYNDPFYIESVISAVERGVSIQIVIATSDIEKNEKIKKWFSCDSDDTIEKELQAFIERVSFLLQEKGLTEGLEERLPKVHVIKNRAAIVDRFSQIICLHISGSYLLFRQSSASFCGIENEVDFLVHLPKRESKLIVEEMRSEGMNIPSYQLLNNRFSFSNKGGISPDY